MSIVRPLDIIVVHGRELVPAGLDPWDFSLQVAGFPNSRILLLDPALPAAEQESRLRSFLAHEDMGLVVLAGLDPEHRAATARRLLLEKFGLNPEFIEVVDLQEALEQPHRGPRLIKALDLVRLAATKVTRAWPIVPQEVPVSTQVLVWGDSYAALTAAAHLADLGYPVILATPNPALSPLSPETARPQQPRADLAPLVQRVQNHPAIRLLPEAQILDVGGVTGNFTLRLGTPAGGRQERVGAVLLAPELKLLAAPERYGLPVHPRIISQTRLEELLAAPPEPASPLTSEANHLPVALLVGAGVESCPPALRRALNAASHLLDRRRGRVFLLTGQAQVAAPGLEQALRAAQDAGLIVAKLSNPPSVRLAGEEVRLSFFDPVLQQEITLAPHLVVYDEEYRAAPGNQELARLLGLAPGPRGFLQADNVHDLPVATARRGIYVVGPGRTVMDLEPALAEAEAAVLAVQGLLGQGRALAPQGWAVVDRGRCVLCLTCHRLCPHGAITFDNRAIINEIACQGCGVCASECPNEAIQIRNYTDDQLLARYWAFNPQLNPRLVAFMCRNSAWEAYQAALKLHHATLPLGFTAIRMPCAGKIDLDYLLKAFTNGAQAVLVLACHPDNCQSHRGNEYARWRVEQAQALLTEAGLDPRRLLYRTLAANAPQDFLDAVEELKPLL